jgi:hypothetical protein
MKKIIICIILALSGNISISLAQTKTANKLGTSSKLSKNDSLMCAKEWKVVSVEEWAVKSKPDEKHKDDMLIMGLDGKYNLILFGNKKEGTWTRSGQYIYFVDIPSGEKFSYKVVSVEPKKIKVDYRDADEVHSIFEMEPK